MWCITTCQNIAYTIHTLQDGVGSPAGAIFVEKT